MSNDACIVLGKILVVRTSCGGRKICNVDIVFNRKVNYVEGKIFIFYVLKSFCLLYEIGFRVDADPDLRVAFVYTSQGFANDIRDREGLFGITFGKGRSIE